VEVDADVIIVDDV